MSHMESTLFLPYALSQQFYGVPAEMYNQVYPANSSISQPSSFVRSSAQHSSSPRQFYRNYSRSPAGVFQGEPISSSASPSSSSSLAAPMNVQEHPQDFSEPNYAFTATAAVTYPLENSVPRGTPYVQEGQMGYSQLPSAKFEPQLDGRYADAPAYTQNFFDRAAEMQFSPPEMSSYYDGSAGGLSQEPALTAYTLHDDQLPSVVHSFSHSPRIEQPGSPESVYTNGSPLLQYPPTPDEAPQYVSLQDVSPSPAVSPDQVYSSLPTHSATLNTSVLTGSYVVGQPASPSSVEYEEPFSDATPTAGMFGTTNAPPRKRLRVSSDEEDSRVGSIESGESEREDDDGEDDDEYRPGARDGGHARSESPFDVQRPRLAPPVPVPNLTKKSRGRRVPTSAVLVSQNGVEKNIRGYKCKVPGCNKCFQRGEHLKRHVRSIHTNDKPHKCPYKKCGKDFSRHDNLRQHMRVHRNEPLDSEEMVSA
ncbi:uncharacterized protein PHACADRAFT_169221 [Phanerochaete carnosa HHB-10118-sp]|uniref:C2H2-type domain-containing protein n=1 Tax=Phanerochaete carnosa (strain HHB-10118-sp) TaxID=650164 RepID=K5XFB5_PHACS|nr:uncharacterized protein PHACADRAFT_169221 [Phanerochaete carnosa HHB-10118-sp]EKM61782.1 hypothetical protein PHACADRAFT_169221 [Phanerochaete carnosa HHB-10118-sp]